jgi:hypothetical protein
MVNVPKQTRGKFWHGQTWLPIWWAMNLSSYGSKNELIIKVANGGDRQAKI